MNAVEELTELYDSRREDYVRMYLSRAGRCDVEDLIQEAFYRALYYIDSYNPALVTVEYWMSGIIENCLKDLYREKRNGSCMHDKLTPESAIIEPRFDEGLHDVVLREVGNKKGVQKDILYFYFMCGYELKEIFTIVDSSYTVVNQTVSRFKSYLRSTYPEYSED